MGLREEQHMVAHSARKRAEGEVPMLGSAPQPLRKRKAEEVSPTSNTAPHSTGVASVSPAQASSLAKAVATIRDPRTAPAPLLCALAELRRDMSATVNPPIQALLDAGGAEALVRNLRGSSAAVKLEVAWVLGNIAVGTSAQAAALVQAGVVEEFFAVLASPEIADRADLVDQCLWALGNIAGDEDTSLRDGLLSMGIVNELGQLYAQLPSMPWDEAPRFKVLRTLTWLMGALCKGSPAPKLEEVDCAFDYFAQVVTGTDDAQMLHEAMWGLCSLVEGAASDDEACARATHLLSAGFGSPEEAPQPPAVHPVLAKVVACLRRTSEGGAPLPIPAMRLLGALVSVPASGPTDAALGAGALAALGEILSDGRAPTQVHRDAAWILSNIAAGTSAQAQALHSNKCVWESLCKAMQAGSSPKLQREALWAVTNVAKRGVPVGDLRVNSLDMIHLVARALQGEADPALQGALLDAAEVSLRGGDHQAAAEGLMENPLVEVVERQTRLLDELEDLQHSADESIYRKAVYIVATWFGGGENRENERPPQQQEVKTPTAHMSSAICKGSPTRPAAYKFGA